MKNQQQTKDEKYIKYATIIGSKISELFEESEDGFFIDLEELEQDDNLNHFFHALSNIVPVKLLNSITNSDKNVLEHNHIANRLIFQFSKLNNSNEDKI